MELNFGTLLFISFSSTLLLFPATQCNAIPVSYISEVPAASPAPGPSIDPKFPSGSTFFIPRSLSRAAPRSKPHSGEAALSKLCANTENPKLCVSSILPSMKGGVTVDPVVALETEIKTFLVLIDKAIAELNKVNKDPSTSAKSRKCLDVCLEIYNSAKDDFTDAHEAIAAHDMELLQSELSGSITDLGTCDDTFEEMGIELPLDKDLVKTLHELADNCMDISELLI